MELMAQLIGELWHQPSDEIEPSWDYAGIVQDAEAFLMLALLIAEDSEPPRWKATTDYPEFAALHKSAESGPVDD